MTVAAVSRARLGSGPVRIDCLFAGQRQHAGGSKVFERFIGTGTGTPGAIASPSVDEVIGRQAGEGRADDLRRTVVSLPLAIIE